MKRNRYRADILVGERGQKTIKLINLFAVSKELTGAGPGGNQSRHHWSEGLQEMREPGTLVPGRGQPG